MSLVTKNKKIKGIIVWDFDGVLFETKRFKRNIGRFLKKYGVSELEIRTTENDLRKKNIPFSFLKLLRTLSENHRVPSAHVLEKHMTALLQARCYCDANAMRVLRKLTNQGFLHIMITFGAETVQLKKIYTGCGKTLCRNFSKVIVTQKEKFTVLKKIRQQYKSLPIYFIDDFKKNIILARKHVHRVIALHYTARSSLNKTGERVYAHQKWNADNYSHSR